MAFEHHPNSLSLDKDTLKLVLLKLFNTLGNSYLVSNFNTKPFDFDVKIHETKPSDGFLYGQFKYIIYIGTDRIFPKTFEYKEKSRHGAYIRADRSVISREFKKLLLYVESADIVELTGIVFTNVLD